MPDKPRADADWWDAPVPMLGSVIDMPSEQPDAAPTLLVPDGHGGWREHQPEPKRRRLGFV